MALCTKSCGWRDWAIGSLESVTATGGAYAAIYGNWATAGIFGTAFLVELFIHRSWRSDGARADLNRVVVDIEHAGQELGAVAGQVTGVTTDLSRENAALHQNNTQLRGTVDTLRAENGTLRATADRLIREISEVRRINEELKATNQALSASVKTLQDKLQMFKIHLAAFAKGNAQFTDRLKEFGAGVAAFAAEEDQLEEATRALDSSLDDEVDDLQTLLSQVKESSQKTYESLMRQNEDLKAQNGSLRASIATLASENDEMQARVAELDRISKENKELLEALREFQTGLSQASVSSAVDRFGAGARALSAETDRIEALMQRLTQILKPRDAT